MKTLIIGVLLSAYTVPSGEPQSQQGRSWSESHYSISGQASGLNWDRDDKHPKANKNVHHKNGDNGRHLGQKKRAAWQDYHRYDYNRYDPVYGNYRANRYYREGSYYRERRLSQTDRIYRGSDNRYYCRRSDGTTGLIIGAMGGGILGQVIAPDG